MSFLFFYFPFKNFLPDLPCRDPHCCFQELSASALGVSILPMWESPPASLALCVVGTWGAALAISSCVHAWHESLLQASLNHVSDSPPTNGSEAWYSSGLCPSCARSLSLFLSLSPPLCLSLSPFLSPPPSPLFNMQQRTESNYLAIGPGRAPHPALWLLMVSSHLQEDAGRQAPGLAEES